jgi:hypothetical protein
MRAIQDNTSDRCDAHMDLSHCSIIVFSMIIQAYKHFLSKNE